jgi:hypothetical protein
MGWKIIKDHGYEKSVKRAEKYGTSVYGTSYEGKERDYQGGKMQVRTWDDDGNLYYTAVCDDENSAEAFHDWSQYDSGSVRSQIRVKGNAKWEEFIS